MGKVKANAVPLLIGAALGYFLVPYVLNAVRNR